ncbi:hypothetical protein [Levilactobacillus namurensis]|uniref:hypothetical protein n=1 Tax=Levilactobacillus namurensis TaxID=380393 RepID=UPI0026EB8027|nr:hypothetical protein [Levilactobacillus namurensis]
MTRWKKYGIYVLLLGGLVAFVYLGRQTTSAQQPIQEVQLVKRTNVKHTDELSNYSPDKRYRSGDLVIKNGSIYEVRVMAKDKK